MAKPQDRETPWTQCSKVTPPAVRACSIAPITW
jgi:hypothetical protein